MNAIFRHIRPEARNAIRGQLIHSLVPAASATDREWEQQQQQQHIVAILNQAPTTVNRWSTAKSYRPPSLAGHPDIGVFNPSFITTSTENNKPKAMDLAAACVVNELILDEVCTDATKSKVACVDVCSKDLTEVATPRIFDGEEKKSSPVDVSLLTSGEADDMVAWLVDGDSAERRFATEQITGLLWPLACSQNGSRVVQRALEIVEPQEKIVLAAQLRGHVREAAKSPHANYVLQKCVELLPNEQIQFILEEIQGRAVVTSRHRFGCRILQRLIEHCPTDQTETLVNEVMSDAPRLCRHPFGNFVLQHILEHGTKDQQSAVVDVLVEDAPGLARHRIASHVLQRALVHCTARDRDKLVDALTDGSAEELKSLAHSQYGSFVVREITGKRQA